jgi:hypothetical protein
MAHIPEHPTLEDIARDTGMTIEQASKAVKGLVEKGILVPEDKALSDDYDGHLVFRGAMIGFAVQVIVCIIIGVLFALAWSQQTAIGW